MKRTHIIEYTLAAALTWMAVGCSSSTDEADEDETDVAAAESPLQCRSSTYVAFDSANHANQDIRVAVHAEISDLLSQAADDMTAGDTGAAEAKFVSATDLYMDAAESASLREKVMGRVDEHVAGDPLQGERIDQTIVQWLEFGRAATDPLEAAVAKQWVDKTLTEFFFLSVHHELLAGTRKNWDEAFGYYGSGAENDEGDLKAFALVASKRDATNGTTLESEIYNNLIDGSCEIELALREADVEALEGVTSHDALGPIIDDIDMAMQRVLAYSVGHEAYEMVELLEAAEVDTAEITIKAAELIPYFMPLERIMNDRGGESADRAAEIRSLIDPMPVSGPDEMDVTDMSWVDALGDAPARIIELMEAEYDIQING